MELGGEFLIVKLSKLAFFDQGTAASVRKGLLTLIDAKISSDMVLDYVVKILPIILASLIAYVIVDNLLIMIYFVVMSSNRRGIIREWLKVFQWSVLSMIFIGMLGVFLGTIYFAYGKLVVLMFFFPFLMFRYAYAGMTSIQKGYIDTIQAFSAALEAKDRYTIGHARRVEKYCEIIAAEMNLSLGRTKVLKYASLLHDIGKIGISEAILNKNDRLTQEEYEEIKKHPVIGAQMLDNIQFLKREVRIIRAHHVHYDGKGYPADAAEDAKLLEAQILCAADSFDAMTSDRAYRPAMSMEEAIDEMLRYSGTQFAPEVVTAFIRGLNKRKSKDELNEIMK
jgi:putative nucleotidyltransferase with HDIG domain